MPLSPAIDWNSLVPVYVYECQPNAHRFEVRQGVNDPRVESCPECGSTVRRVILPVGIVFKGAGFYATDSRSSNAPVKSADSSNAAKSEGDSNGGEKREGDRSGGEKTETAKDGEAKSSGNKSKSTGESSGGSGQASEKSETPAAS